MGRWLGVVLSVSAARPVDYKPVDFETSITDIVGVWRHADGSLHCWGDTVAGFISNIWNRPTRLDNETLNAYLPRAWDLAKAGAVPLTPGQQVLCDQLEAANTEIWLVDNKYSTRRAYARLNFETQVYAQRVPLTRILAGAPCRGFVRQYSEKIRILSWREVDLPGGVTGVAVCKKQ